MIKNSTDWCILRMAPSRTLMVARSLADAGYEVWTPVEAEVKRIGPSRKRVDRAIPMTPTFVFARYEHLDALIALSKSPDQTYRVWDRELRRTVVRGIPAFRVFRHLDTYPRLADHVLDPLRRIERRRKPRLNARVFRPGEQVQYPDAGFEGLTGIVEGLRGRYAIVAFPGFPIAIQIDARYLQPATEAA